MTPDGVPFIVMELLLGESLAALLEREGAQSEGRTIRVASDILKSLMEAHALGIVHRDIKPANIFITRHAGEPFFVKLLDFGIAKEVDSDLPSSVRVASTEASAALTHASHALGTPRYMAPEQVMGDPVSAATDLYALGLTLAEMVTGTPVFASESVLDVFRAHASAESVPLAQAISSSRLGAIIARATRKLLDERYASAEAMLFDVDALDASPDRPVALGAVRIDTDRVGAQIAFEATQETPLASKRLGAVTAPFPASSANPLPASRTIPAYKRDTLAARLVALGWEIKPGGSPPESPDVVVLTEKGMCGGSVQYRMELNEKVALESFETTGKATQWQYPLIRQGGRQLLLAVGAMDPSAPHACGMELYQGLTSE